MISAITVLAATACAPERAPAQRTDSVIVDLMEEGETTVNFLAVRGQTLTAQGMVIVTRPHRSVCVWRVGEEMAVKPPTVRLTVIIEGLVMCL